MMEFTKDELEVIVAALTYYGKADELAMLIASEIDRLNDIENMDFDDCAGGGCKL